MGNEESSRPRSNVSPRHDASARSNVSPRSNVFENDPDETKLLEEQRYLTDGRTSQGGDDDDIPVPPPYIPDASLSPESEAEIPIFDDDHSTPITGLPVPSDHNTPVQEALSQESPVANSNSTPVYRYISTPPGHKNQTPFAVYIDDDDQITPDTTDKTPVYLSDTQNETHKTSEVNTESNVTRSNSIISSKTGYSEIQSHGLSPVEYQSLRNCLLNLPLEGQEMQEKAIERVASHILIQDYEARTDILMKGESAKGIFIIISGAVNVLSENGTHVLATLRDGNYFGEISVLFDCPCTARVQTVTRSKLAVLDVNTARRLLHKVDVDIMDYFVTKKYLPTGDHIDAERTQRRMVLTYLKQLPIFEQWSDVAIKDLIMQIKPAFVILYRENTVVVCEQDPPVALYIIIRGRALIKKDDKVILEIDADRDPAVIGEEGMYLGYKSAVSIQTSTCCQIILIKEECIQNIRNKYTSEASDFWKSRELNWKALVDRDDILYQTYPHLLQFEVVYHFLKNHRIFSSCSPRCVQHIALQGIPYKFSARETVCVQEEYEDCVYVLVLTGQIELLTIPEMRYAYTVNTGDIFCHCDWMPDKGKIIARSDCLVLKIDNSDITEALEQYNDSHLVLPSKPK